MKTVMNYNYRFTDADEARADALAAPFNKKYNSQDPDDDNSMTMVARWMTEDGQLVFAVIDDLTGSTSAIVVESNVALFTESSMRLGEEPRGDNTEADIDVNAIDVNAIDGSDISMADVL